MSKARRNWSEREQRLICLAYTVLMAKEKRGQETNKAALCRLVLPHLENRTRGSYELKMMNVSAALESLAFDEYVPVKGYKPYGHAQKSLSGILSSVLHEVTRDGELEPDRALERLGYAMLLNSANK